MAVATIDQIFDGRKNTSTTSHHESSLQWRLQETSYVRQIRVYQECEVVICLAALNAIRRDGYLASIVQDIATLLERLRHAKRIVQR